LGGLARDVPETLLYRVKCRLLGPPLVTERLSHERLSKRLALGVLSSDCISSSAYGTEEMLIELLPVFGVAGFSLLLPMTGIILVILVLMTMSYREVVTVYTQAGGSYVVARDNFGPRVAQIAAVALMLDYVVTVAVQSAAGTAAVLSALPGLGPYQLEITIAVVLLLAYGNLRGIREAGRSFAFPTYFFVGSMAVVIVVGLVKELFGDLPKYAPAAGMIPVTDKQSALLSLGAIYMLARAFANGGSSLTGLEAISNGVSAFRRPEGLNARRTLVVMSTILGSLVLGVSWLAYQTHATPYAAGNPTVISQVARAALGQGAFGQIGFYLVQLATMLILYTGANTSFNGFPFLASFVAEDSFLPRQLTRRGHRLAFSNGIIVLTVASLALLIGVGAHVNALVPFYAIGVFTGFTMAGFGMAKYHTTHKERGWHHKLVINAAGGAASLLVVLIFATVKFTEGAWLIVVIFPVLFVLLVRLNRQYREEAAALATLAPILDVQPNPGRHLVLVFVDTLDLATLRALRYARGMRPDEVRAVHFVLDAQRAAELGRRWRSIQRGDIDLELLDCPDRRLRRAALDLVARSVAGSRTEVTVLLPRRTYPALIGRLLHDRTADKIASVVSLVPNAAATIVPFDVSVPSRKLAEAREGRAGARPATVAPELADGTQRGEQTQPGEQGEPAAPSGPPKRPAAPAAERPDGTIPAERPDGTIPVAGLAWRQRATVEGRIRSVRVKPMTNSLVLECEVCDDTGAVSVLFYGRDRIPGIDPGRRVRLSGRVGERHGQLAIANPTYQLLGPEDPHD